MEAHTKMFYGLFNYILYRWVVLLECVQHFPFLLFILKAHPIYHSFFLKLMEIRNKSVEYRWLNCILMNTLMSIKYLEYSIIFIHFFITIISIVALIFVKSILCDVCNIVCVLIY